MEDIFVYISVMFSGEYHGVTLSVYQQREAA